MKYEYLTYRPRLPAGRLRALEQVVCDLFDEVLGRGEIMECAWFDNVVGDACFLVAKSTNSAYKDYMIEITRHYRRHILRGTLGDKKADHLLNDAYSKYIILDWKNVEDKNGVDVPYSPEIGYRYLTDLSEFRGIISELADRP